MRHASTANHRDITVAIPALKVWIGERITSSVYRAIVKNNAIWRVAGWRALCGTAEGCERRKIHLSRAVREPPLRTRGLVGRALGQRHSWPRAIELIAGI